MRNNTIQIFKNSFRISPFQFNFQKVQSFRPLSSEPFNPVSKAVDTIKDDFRILLGKKPENRFPSHCDVLIIGGGVMGSSVAYWLKNRALEGLNVAVIEKDPTYQQCTSVLSVGGLRQQFSLKENIELSLKSAQFLRNIKDYLSIEGMDPPDIQFHPSSYLFLASEKGQHIIEENVKLQRSLGAKVDLLSPVQLKERFPWLNVDDLAIGSHGLENEGWFDPYSLLFALKRKALHLGAHFIPAEVTGFEADPGQLSSEDGTLRPRDFHTAIVKTKDGEERQIEFGILVVAAGGLSGKLGDLLGMGKGIGPLSCPLPVEPRKRYVFNVHCPDGPGVLSPLLVDTTGAYFRREGLTGHYLCGMSPPDEEEPPIDNLDVDYSFFEEKVWPILAHRVPAFETAKVKSAWAGYYDFNRFDENAFVGLHPGYNNVYLATGFSGHGIQQSPMIGKAIMELIVDSQYKTVNLERFHFDRFIKNEPLWESNIV